MTPLTASHTLAQATQSTREKLRNPVADTEGQFQVCREAALALASVPGMALLLRGFGDIAQGTMAVSLGHGQGTVLSPTVSRG